MGFLTKRDRSRRHRRRGSGSGRTQVFPFSKMVSSHLNAWLRHKIHAILSVVPTVQPEEVQCENRPLSP
jgi:hypothetical protein